MKSVKDPNSFKEHSITVLPNSCSLVYCPACLMNVYNVLCLVCLVLCCVGKSVKRRYKLEKDRPEINCNDIPILSPKSG